MANRDKHYWFGAKRYGWGWGLPIAWQGWVVFALWFAAVLLPLRYLLPRNFTVHLTFVVLMVTLLLVICYIKGEPPRWRWGDQDQ